jgi:hypothetical protein
MNLAIERNPCNYLTPARGQLASILAEMDFATDARGAQVNLGLGLAHSVFSCLLRVSRFVEAQCQYTLMDLARHMDAASGCATLEAQTLAEFHAAVNQLRSICCNTAPNSSNVWFEVLTWMPLLSKVSGVKSDDTKAQPLHPVIILGQSIMNEMTNWQDQLGEFIECEPQSVGVGFYEAQIKAGLIYWRTLQAILTNYLDRKI